MTRTIPAANLSDEHIGHLVSHPGCPEPERLSRPAYRLNHNVVLQYRREYDGHPYWVAVAVKPDTEITIHDEPEEA